MVDIQDGEPEVQMLERPPHIEDLAAGVRQAHFTGSGDSETVIKRLTEFDSMVRLMGSELTLPRLCAFGPLGLAHTCPARLMFLCNC